MPNREPLATRIAAAEALWQQGDALLAAADGAAAYRAYTAAHDLILDCPRLHLRAHQKLRQVTREHGERGELITDTLLLWLAPLGVFELIAWAVRSSVKADAACRRSAAT